MANGTVIVNGVIHGKTIDLDEDSGLPDGQAVTVMLRPALPAGEGLRRAFGSWAQDADQLDEFVEQIYRDREDGRPGPTE